MTYVIIVILCVSLLAITFASISSKKEKQKEDSEWTEEDGDFFIYMASKGMIKGEDEDE